MKRRIAKKLLGLLRFERRPFNNIVGGHPIIEIRVFLGNTQTLLLRATFNYQQEKRDFEQY